MANRPVPPLDLADDDRTTLITWSRIRALPQRLVLRARIVLLAVEGVPNRQIAARTATSQPTVQLWRSRYQSGGLTALEIDQPGRGRPKVYGDDLAPKIISTTLGNLRSRPPSRRAHRRRSPSKRAENGRPPLDATCADHDSRVDATA